MREFVNKHGVPIIVAALVLAIVIFLIFRHTKGSSKITGDVNKGFFIDEQTNEESVHPLDELPPLPNKDGNLTVVRAMKYHSPDGKQSNILYLLKYTPEAKAKFNAAPDDASIRAQILDSEAELVREPEAGSPWVRGDSLAAQKIVQPPDGWSMSFPGK